MSKKSKIAFKCTDFHNNEYTCGALKHKVWCTYTKAGKCIRKQGTLKDFFTLKEVKEALSEYDELLQSRELESDEKVEEVPKVEDVIKKIEKLTIIEEDCDILIGEFIEKKKQNRQYIIKRLRGICSKRRISKISGS